MATKKKAPAKKKAPPKKKAAKKKPAKKKRAPTVALAKQPKAELAPDDKKDRHQLRHYAQMLYTTALDGTTVAEVSKHPMLAHIPETTIVRWSVQDQWSEKRRLTLEGWKAQIESKIGDALVQSRIHSVKRLQVIRDKLFDKLTPDNHDWEDGGFITVGGMPFPVCKVCGNTQLQHIDPFAGVPGDRAVKALMDLVSMELQLQEMILQVTQTPGYGQRHAAGGARGQSGPPVAKVELNQDEMREAAMTILRRRREEMRGSP